jgi:hypothetical protein
MGLGDIVDEFPNQDGLSDTCTSEETNFTTTIVRSKKVNDLDTSLQNLRDVVPAVRSFGSLGGTISR